ncbi:type II toxin-antitoxin system Phd/YefM family antitoxin [Microvirga roseola]|uniref:type II toxin-antitoxin system Phd/YefM family antitoxin n=1 Tax=Microvirga roseola TaxID=2883126 RepID=UPI001E30245D|nr:type II toxin-antitoxin system Phd/YefM family antitoxin [Microvirga roseola]
MRTFTTADLNKKVGDITDAARREPVLLTHHRKPRFVLMSVEAYESLTQSKTGNRRTGFTLETIPDDVAGGLLALADQYEREGGNGDA